MVAFTILAGTYTQAISAFLFNPANASLSLLSSSPAGNNPSWLDLHPTNKSILYATQEQSNGAVLSFTIGAQGKLTLVANVSSAGQDPASLLAHSNGKEVIVMDYSSGTGVPIKLASDHVNFAESLPVVKFTGSGPNPDRQLSPHPHQVVEYKDELLIPDLGSDKVWRLARDYTTGGWRTAGFVSHVPGSGPRHAVADNGLLWTLCELDNTLYLHTLPPVYANSLPTLLAQSSILSPDRPAGSSYGAAELRLSPVTPTFPTRYLYASNRNVSPTNATLDPLGDTIAIFQPYPLKLVKQVHTGVQQIRGMTIGGDKGQYIAVAGLNGGGVAVFERVDGGKDLKLVARYTGPGSTSVVSFVWL
jgi:6-phosphogluconolactonase (cycloisomerase 2 family)